MKSVKNNNQSGNVLFLILIAIALFAGLSYVVTQSSRSGTGGAIDKDKASLNAGKILNFAVAIKTAVTRISVGGCADTNISFENNVVLLYTNTNSPPDECKLFRPEGGGITWQSAPTEVNDGTDWIFTGKTAVSGLGVEQPCNAGENDCTELLMTLINVDQQTCLKINEKLGVDNPGGDAPLEDSADEFDDPFTGTYDTQNVIGETATELQDKAAGCFKETAANTDPPAQNDYVFYFVLLER